MSALTPYDTGQRAEPQVWVDLTATAVGPAYFDRYGKVDFEDDEGSTVATIWLDKNEHSGEYVVHIEKHRPMGLRIYQED